MVVGWGFDRVGDYAVDAEIVEDAAYVVELPELIVVGGRDRVICGGDGGVVDGDVGVDRVCPVEGLDQPVLPVCGTSVLVEAEGGGGGGVVDWTDAPWLVAEAAADAGVGGVGAGRPEAEFDGVVAHGTGSDVEAVVVGEGGRVDGDARGGLAEPVDAVGGDVGHFEGKKECPCRRNSGSLGRMIDGICSSKILGCSGEVVDGVRTLKVG